MVTSFPIFNIGDKILNTISGKKGKIYFVHSTNLLENIFLYNVIYDDNSTDSFVQERDLEKIRALREPI